MYNAVILIYMYTDALLYLYTYDVFYISPSAICIVMKFSSALFYTTRVQVYLCVFGVGVRVRGPHSTLRYAFLNGKRVILYVEGRGGQRRSSISNCFIYIYMQSEIDVISFARLVDEDAEISEKNGNFMYEFVGLRHVRIGSGVLSEKLKDSWRRAVV